MRGSSKGRQTDTHTDTHVRSSDRGSSLPQRTADSCPGRPRGTSLALGKVWVLKPEAGGGQL